MLKINIQLFQERIIIFVKWYNFRPDFYTKIGNRQIISNLIPELKSVPFVYNSSGCLWTSKELKNDIEYYIRKERLPPSISKTLNGTGKLKISIFPNQKEHCIKASDFLFPRRENDSLTNLLESIIFEHSLRNGFCQVQNKTYFGPENDFGWGLFARNGCKSEVQLIQGHLKNESKFVILLNSVKQVFYPEINFLEGFKRFIEKSESLSEASKIFFRTWNDRLRGSTREWCCSRFRSWLFDF